MKRFSLFLLATLLGGLSLVQAQKPFQGDREDLIGYWHAKMVRKGKGWEGPSPFLKTDKPQKIGRRVFVIYHFRSDGTFSYQWYMSSVPSYEEEGLPPRDWEGTWTLEGRRLSLQFTEEGEETSIVEVLIWNNKRSFEAKVEGADPG